MAKNEDQDVTGKSAEKFVELVNGQLEWGPALIYKKDKKIFFRPLEKIPASKRKPKSGK